MYFHIPKDIENSVFRKLRRRRALMLVKHYPAVVVVFSAVAMYGMVIKGHMFLAVLPEDFKAKLNTRNGLYAVAGVVTVIVGVFIAYFSWEQFRDCVCEDLPYCPRCDAVDSYENGFCPICKQPLGQRLRFFSTFAKSEIAMLEDAGARRCRHTGSPSNES